MLILVSLTHGHMNILACKHAVYSVCPRVRGLYIVNPHARFAGATMNKTNFDDSGGDSFATLT